MATEPTKLNGKVVNGVVVFENGSLPEGTQVSIERIKGDAEQSRNNENVGDMLLSLAGIIKDDSLPPDLSVNLDHYLYGAPKKE